MRYMVHNPNCYAECSQTQIKEKKSIQYFLHITVMLGCYIHLPLKYNLDNSKKLSSSTIYCYQFHTVYNYSLI